MQYCAYYTPTTFTCDHYFRHVVMDVIKVQITVETKI